MLGETIYLLIIRRQVFYSVAIFYQKMRYLIYIVRTIFSASDFKFCLVIGNFIILELSPWNFHHEIPCYWVKFHAIINFTREAQVITYLCTYLCFFTVFRTYPMYYLPGTSCESSWKFYESSSESFTRSLKSWSFQSLILLCSAARMYVVGSWYLPITKILLTKKLNFVVCLIGNHTAIITSSVFDALWLDGSGLVARGGRFCCVWNGGRYYYHTTKKKLSTYLI